MNGFIKGGVMPKIIENLKDRLLAALHPAV